MTLRRGELKMTAIWHEVVQADDDIAEPGSDGYIGFVVAVDVIFQIVGVETQTVAFSGPQS